MGWKGWESDTETQRWGETDSEIDTERLQDTDSPWWGGGAGEGKGEVAELGLGPGRGGESAVGEARRGSFREGELFIVLSAELKLTTTPE